MINFEFINQADVAALNLEKAKRALELAKEELEACKMAYDKIFSQAEDEGLSKAKLRKLTDERIQAMIDVGLMEGAALNKTVSSSSKPEKAKRAKKKSSLEESMDDFDAGSEEETQEEAEEISAALSN